MISVEEWLNNSVNNLLDNSLTVSGIQVLLFMTKNITMEVVSLMIALR
jgi:hypothetical protein